MSKPVFKKTECEDQAVLSATKEDGVLLCDWMIGITADFQEKDKLNEFDRMGLLN